MHRIYHCWASNWIVFVIMHYVSPSIRDCRGSDQNIVCFSNDCIGWELFIHSLHAQFNLCSLPLTDATTRSHSLKVFLNEQQSNWDRLRQIGQTVEHFLTPFVLCPKNLGHEFEKFILGMYKWNSGFEKYC